MSEIRAKSTVVGTDTELQVKGASSKPSYEAITQQIAYLMSAVTNQNNQSVSKDGGCTGFKSNGNGKYPSTTLQRPFQRLKRDKKNMTCWGWRLGRVGGSGEYSWQRVLHTQIPSYQSQPV